MDGFELRQPSITMNRGARQQARDGTFQIKGKIAEPMELKNWLFVYSRGGKYDDQDADYAFDQMKRASGVFGITVSEPGWIDLRDSRLETWTEEIRKDVAKNGAPAIVVLFFNQQEERLYGQLKKLLTNELGVASQVIRKRTLSQKSKSVMSCASKILLQMNAKLGLKVSLVQLPEGFNNVMVGALSISNGPRGSTLAFVGSTSKDCSSIFSRCKTGIARKEDIP